MYLLFPDNRLWYKKGDKNMPISKDKAPDTLPSGAKSIFVGAFNSALRECTKNGKSESQCDSRAAKIAWSAVKKVYSKNGKGKWVRKKKSE